MRGITIKTCLAIYFLILAIGSNSFAQDVGDTTDLNTEELEEKLLESIEDENIDETTVLDFLETLKRNPYNLNEVSEQELQNIPFINAIIANRIVEYRKKSGRFNSKRELLRVEGITDELYENIKVYLIVPRSTTDYVIGETGITEPEKVRLSKGLVERFDLRYRARFIQDLQTKAGFLDSSKYLGSKAKIYNQLNFRYNFPDVKFQGNLTIEKDPGETDLNDFSSYGIMMSDYKWINKVIAGDYTLNFGQGLSMWSSLSFSKGVNTVNGLKKRGRETNLYTSVTEVQFFRGGLADLQFGKFNFIGYFSLQSLSASVDTLFDGVTSFKTDGYFRTESEKNKKNAVDETLFGGRLVYKTDGLMLGATYWNSRFSKDLVPDSTRELYDLKGKKANVIGLDYDYVFENINLYGEISRSQSGSVAYISALQMNFLKIADVVFSYRNYPEDFSPVHSYAFGEKSGDSKNETGFYAGITAKPLKGLRIAAYYDIFKFPYRSFFQPTSISGNELLANIEWRAGKGLELYLRYKNENKGLSRTITDEFGRDIKRIDNRNKLNVRIGFNYEVSKTIRLRSRYEYVFVDYDLFGGDNKGFLFFSDIRIIPITGLALETRLTFFQTDSYDSRVYQFENDIKGLFTNVALFGKGTRWFLLAKYKLLDFLELQGKYSVSYIDGSTSIGSGNDEIKGDINNKLNLGLEILF
ncbi:hypothetical protein FBQ84_06435 [Ignavibacteria bacterium CHB1]|nr:MAG: hypothetical protein EDM69_06485 [Chlorobiota bacterium]MBV6399150.1 hypothetical protein [Ignavibacteria bacterium]MCE7953646.1 hypothetical protein [Chlorobi bacterium CHB7]MDL1887464.1 hypothetical protein [Ignavibacteria bacterium CHB1]RIK49169.1 MAG: hypothetical protein DCC60_04270 [Ignavibacteriota bacterium]